MLRLIKALIVVVATTPPVPNIKIAGDDMWQRPLTWVVFGLLFLASTAGLWIRAAQNLWSKRGETKITEQTAQATHVRDQEDSVLASVQAERAAAIQQANQVTAKFIERLEFIIQDQQVQLASARQAEIEYERMKIRVDEYRKQRDVLRKTLSDFRTEMAREHGPRAVAHWDHVIALADEASSVQSLAEASSDPTIMTLIPPPPKPDDK